MSSAAGRGVACRRCSVWANQITLFRRLREPMLPCRATHTHFISCVATPSHPGIRLTPKLPYTHMHTPTHTHTHKHTHTRTQWAGRMRRWPQKLSLLTCNSTTASSRTSSRASSALPSSVHPVPLAPAPLTPTSASLCHFLSERRSRCM